MHTVIQLLNAYQTGKVQLQAEKQKESFVLVLHIALWFPSIDNTKAFLFLGPKLTFNERGIGHIIESSILRRIYHIQNVELLIPIQMALE